MPLISGMFQSDSTRSGDSATTLARPSAPFSASSELVVAEPGLPQRARDDHAHGLAVVDDEDLHGHTFQTLMCRGPAAQTSATRSRRTAPGTRTV